MSTLPLILKDKNELISFAERFLVEDRLNSLENDVKRCLPRYENKKELSGYAPTPALLYCFSIIDLLGSLFSGNAKSQNTSENSRNYMQKFMKYSKDNAILLQKIYRHKIVHLSAPKTAMLYNGKVVTWVHNENTPEKHLTIDSAPSDIDIFGFGKIHCDQYHTISIWRLTDDIIDSVKRPIDGYLKRLEAETDLQSNFVLAINQIYDPVITD